MRFVIFITILVPVLLHSQQYPQFSQGMFDNKCLFNPGATGENEYAVAWIQHRSQWIGFEDAPVTQTIGYKHTLFHNMGLGGFLMNDITGPTGRLGVNALYSYHVKLDKVTQLSFGLSAFLMQYRINGNKVTLTNYSDNAIIAETKDSKLNSDCNFGVFLYNKKFYAGLSVLNLIGSKYRLFKEEQPAAIIELEKHYYAIAGYNLNLGDYYTLESSFLTSKTMTTPAQYSVGLNLNYKKMVFGGLTYRYNDAIVLLAGTKIQDQFVISYSYDMMISTLANHCSGSHEIYLSFEIANNKAKKRYKNHVKAKKM